MAQETGQADTCHLTVEVTRDMRRAVKVSALGRDVSVREWLIEAIDAKLEADQEKTGQHDTEVSQ